MSALAWILGGLGLAGSLASGVATNILNYKATAATNQANAAMMREQNRFNAAEAVSNRLFNAQEAEKQRNWEAIMSNSAYQRSRADMEAAGINPVLAYSQGGAGTPGGAVATGEAAHSATTARLSSPEFVDSVSNSIMKAVLLGTVVSKLPQASHRLKGFSSYLV